MLRCPTMLLKHAAGGRLRQRASSSSGETAHAGGWRADRARLASIGLSMPAVQQSSQMPKAGGMPRCRCPAVLMPSGPAAELLVGRGRPRQELQPGCAPAPSAPSGASPPHRAKQSAGSPAASRRTAPAHAALPWISHRSAEEQCWLQDSLHAHHTAHGCLPSWLVGCVTQPKPGEHVAAVSAQEDQ